MKYKITEIFYSIQGEGSWTGKAAVFVRLANCNLSCAFCDTDFSEKQLMTAQEIYDYANKISLGVFRNVIFTGGEPMLQLEEQLLKKFSHSGKQIAIETNGTIAIPLHLQKRIDCIVVSPKNTTYQQCRGTDLKILVGINKPLIHESVRYLYNSFDNFYLQPVWGENYEKNLQYAVELIKKHPQYKLSIQTQKYINIQ